MMLHNEYLTDEQLNQLISEAEADLMPAPPDLTDNILKAIRDSEEQETVVQRPEELSKETTKIKRKKNLDFAAYCFRVSVAVAASVAFIFIMPYLPGFDMGTDGEEPYTATNYWEPAPLSEEQLAEYDALRNCPTREEVLNDTDFFQKVFWENSIFKENINLDSLKEENGGQ